MKSVLTIRSRDWQQETYETGSGDATKRARKLRKLDYRMVTNHPEVREVKF